MQRGGDVAGWWENVERGWAGNDEWIWVVVACSWLNTNMMETRQILETSDLDGFEKVQWSGEGVDGLSVLCERGCAEWVAERVVVHVGVGNAETTPVAGAAGGSGDPGPRCTHSEEEGGRGSSGAVCRWCERGVGSGGSGGERGHGGREPGSAGCGRRWRRERVGGGSSER